MKLEKSFVLLFCLIGAGIACSCLPATPRARYWRQKWVYSALVVSEESDDEALQKRYEVVIQGVLKRSGKFPFDYIGGKTWIYTGQHSCQGYLEVGKVYVVGGSIIDGKKHFISCDFPALLSTNQQPGLDFSPCSARGCAAWNDGYGTVHFCDLKGNVIHTSPRKDGEPFCESTEFSDFRCDRCFKGCKTFYDGCNTCKCANDGTFLGCTKIFCFRKAQPRCLDPEECPHHECPPGKTCELAPKPTNGCGKFKVLKGSTYRCDPLSEWSKLERKECLKKNNYDTLGCIGSICCTKQGSGPGGVKRQNYCNQSEFCKCSPRLSTL